MQCAARELDTLRAAGSAAASRRPAVCSSEAATDTHHLRNASVRQQKQKLGVPRSSLECAPPIEAAWRRFKCAEMPEMHAANIGDATITRRGDVAARTAEINPTRPLVCGGESAGAIKTSHATV